MSELSLLCDEIGTALLLISHDLAWHINGDKIAILDFGHIVESGNIKRSWEIQKLKLRKD